MAATGSSGGAATDDAISLLLAAAQAVDDNATPSTPAAAEKSSATAAAAPVTLASSDDSRDGGSSSPAAAAASPAAASSAAASPLEAASSPAATAAATAATAAVPAVPRFALTTGPEFKVVLVGDGGVGKTSLLQRYLTGLFEKKYLPTLGVEVRKLRLDTTAGPITFAVWDCAGQEQFSGLREAYYISGQAAILMFDVTARSTYKSMPNHARDVARVMNRDLTKEEREANMHCSFTFPVVICGNKVDVRERAVKPREITLHRRLGVQYYDISVKSNYNFEKPFLYLARKLVGDPSLNFSATPALAPATVTIDDKAVRDLEASLAAADLSEVVPAEDDPLP